MTIKTCLVLSEDALAYLKQRTGRGRGQSAYVESLIQCDKTRREMRQLLEREQEVSTVQTWEQTGCRVD